ncbi:TetR/AcrR family transcriptional regulator [Ulvibacter litoralis]|uniref:DNA-binding transcriptional regulator, AcrR family n=1 Tax=Ulvibacter litoralis TaxID=227084 RepID=A0A1G7ER41_9FLAO|nr:TetR/AcrR family transcriptional regulator [Ulvibacter litoralis]GHC54210.1 TetR family transcriptional regulator [Ulvibacter litoralis]SDE66123.1 DNA-binding transcriptional regulator, AcrR family [Ulvibacter litoralis]
MNKKETILVKALELLTEKGVHNTPMSAIAKAAGTGMGTIYNYFPNKEALINDIYVSIKEQEKSVFLDFDSDAAIKPQFENYFTSIIEFFIANPTYFKFMEQLQASPIITNESRDLGQQSVVPVFQLIEKGKKDQIIKNIEIDELLMFTGGAILSYLRWYFNNLEAGKASLTNQINMVWDALKE